MKIAFISPEVYPFAKTGGLADVAGVLPKTLEMLGHEVKVFMPKYDLIDESMFGLQYNWDVGEMPIRVAGHIRSAHLYQTKLPDSNFPAGQTGVEINFIECPHYFNRGKIYTTDNDEDERFILLCKGVIEALQRLKWAPDVIHCNDWQTGLIPLYIKDNYSLPTGQAGLYKTFKKTSTLFTIHNIGYQGKFSKATLNKADIKPDYFYPGGPVEFYDDISFMKTGISFADIINTVSKTYANEILTPEYGAGMEGVLLTRRNDLYGILNGVDYTIWNPEFDNHIPYRYSINDLSGKLKNKQYLLKQLRLPFNETIPVIGIVSRMAVQKGFDLFEEASPDLMELNAQWVVLGSGEDRYEDMFSALAYSYPEKIYVYIGFNNELSHLIEAAADMFLMPSHYEPCGLNQLFSLKYGTVPIVRKTGGLADTVQDWNELFNNGENTGTGFSFDSYTSYSLLNTAQRAIDIFADRETWRKIQINGMSKNYSWENSALEYIELYKKAIAKRKMDEEK